MPNVHELIRDHVTLSIRCLDRLYLHAYLPKLQTSGGLCYFLRDHLGHPIPSPALFTPMHDRFIAAIKAYATTQQAPLIAFAPIRMSRRIPSSASGVEAEFFEYVHVAAEDALPPFLGRRQFRVRSIRTMPRHSLVECATQ